MSANEESFLCPYCGSSNSLFVDFSGPRRQQLIQDCEICCRPIVIRATLEGTQVVDLQVHGENE